MTIKQMYEELLKLGFPVKMISRHTGISESKFKHMRFGKYANFTHSEVEAFNYYFDKCKALEKVYGDKLAEYLAKGEK